MTGSRTLAALVTAGTFLSACASSPPPRNYEVRVTSNQEAVRGCQSVGMVSASTLNFSNDAAGSVSRKLQAKAAALSANVVLLASMTTTSGQPGETQGLGEAYRCPEPTTSGAEPK